MLDLESDELTCPHCGDTAYDSTGEIECTAQGDTQETQCESCGKSFKWSWESTVTFTSWSDGDEESEDAGPTAGEER